MQEKTAIPIVSEMLDKKVTELCGEQTAAFNDLTEKIRAVEVGYSAVPGRRLYLREVKQAYRRLVCTEGRIEKLSGISNELDSFRRDRER